jgi:hypothetical protein
MEIMQTYAAIDIALYHFCIFYKQHIKNDLI